MSETTLTPATLTASTMTPEQADFAARFADYEIRVRVGTKPVHVEKYDDGYSWLPCGRIKLSPHVRRITVYAYADTNAQTVSHMKSIATDFRDGQSWHRLLKFETRHLDDGREWFCSEELGRNVPSDYEPEGMRVTACIDENCTEQYHEYDSVTILGTREVLHMAQERVDHPAGLYQIGMTRMTGKSWRVEVELNSYELNPFESRGFANDLNWMSIACDKLSADHDAAVA